MSIRFSTLAWVLNSEVVDWGYEVQRKNAGHVSVEGSEVVVRCTCHGVQGLFLRSNIRNGFAWVEFEMGEHSSGRAPCGFQVVVPVAGEGEPFELDFVRG